MKWYFFISLVMLLSCKAIPVEKSNTIFYVGTYTNGESQGIYQYEIDNLGKFKKGSLKAVITNPSFLSKTADNKTLLVVSEVNENNTGFVYSYEINKASLIYKSKSKSGALKLIDFTLTRGNNPRNFSLTPDNRFIVVANQDTNTLVSFLRNEKTGKLSYIDEVQSPNPVCVLF